MRCQGDNLLTVSRPFVNLVHDYWVLNRPRNGKSAMLDESCRWVCPGNPPIMRASRTKMSINKFKPNVSVPNSLSSPQRSTACVAPISPEWRCFGTYVFMNG